MKVRPEDELFFDVEELLLDYLQLDEELLDSLLLDF